MLIRADASDPQLFLAAATVHLAISFFWSVVLRGLLPRRHTILWAIVGALAIGVLDLRVIGRLFPEVLALPFGPQLMDHVAWGATVGVMIAGRDRRVPHARRICRDRVGLEA